jgi:hypothetical protein
MTHHPELRVTIDDLPAQDVSREAILVGQSAKCRIDVVNA